MLACVALLLIKQSDLPFIPHFVPSRHSFYKQGVSLTRCTVGGQTKSVDKTIEGNGWLHTGDVCHMDEEGCIFVVDRKKDMIITAGYNVYPAQIERVVLKLEKVAMCAVGKGPDKLWPIF